MSFPHVWVRSNRVYRAIEITPSSAPELAAEWPGLFSLARSSDGAYEELLSRATNQPYFWGDWVVEEPGRKVSVIPSALFCRTYSILESVPAEPLDI